MGASVVGRDTEFLRHSALIGQIPIADVNVGRVRIVKLDGVQLRRGGGGGGLVGKNAPGNRRRKLPSPWPPQQHAGGAPWRVCGVRGSIPIHRGELKNGGTPG